MSNASTAVAERLDDAPPDSVRRLAAAIKKARERRGWSQRNLAEVTSLNHEIVRRIESGDADPRWSTVMRLAMALDLTSDLPRIMLGQISARRLAR